MKILRKTKSVCPVCLKSINANLIQIDSARTDLAQENSARTDLAQENSARTDLAQENLRNYPLKSSSSNAENNLSNSEIILSKVCEEHGKFEAVVWRGGPDFETWTAATSSQSTKSLEALESYAKNPLIDALSPTFSESFSNQFVNALPKECPHNCGLCAQHGQRTCTVLLELTHACNLHCPVCFANATNINDNKSTEKTNTNTDFLSLDEVREQLAWIHKQAGSIVLQLSGGEPTLYPYLIEVVQTASQLFGAVQLNSNGLLLAQDENLAKKLKEAGLSWVFLQCDGDTDAIHIQLRGQALLETKIKAIENCKKAGLSVVLVSVVAADVNDDKLGDMLRFGLSFFPTVRGVHFQPMTLSGRNIFHGKRTHITLPEVITKLSQQSNGMIKVEHALPSSCEHTLCSFHCRYYVTADGTLQYIRAEADCACDMPVKKKQVNAQLNTTLNSTLNTKTGTEKDTEATTKNNGNYATISDDRFDDAPERSIESIIRSWQGSPQKEMPSKKFDSEKLDSENNPNTIDENIRKDEQNEPDAPGAPDAFDAFINRARNQTFSVTCMAFQDVHTLDLKRLQRCCVHVYDRQNKLIPFCAYNLTSLDGVSLYRKS